jgi:hypothetical protein
MSFGTINPVAGLTLTWGNIKITATSFNVSSGAESEVDVTGIDASAVVTDPNNTQRKLIKKSVDYSVIDLGELSCEFFGHGALTQTHLIGTKRDLTISGAGLQASAKAYLTSVGTQFAAGELVRGNCTFRLSHT